MKEIPENWNGNGHSYEWKHDYGLTLEVQREDVYLETWGAHWMKAAELDDLIAALQQAKDLLAK